MAKKKFQGNMGPPATLRQRAEGLLRARRTDISKLSHDEIHSLVHELEVHQIELELQNEELRQAQFELADARDRFSDLYDFAPVGYVTLQMDGRIIEANMTAAIQLGVHRQNLIGANLSKFVERNAQDDFYFHRQTVFSDEIKHSCELQMHTAKGTPVVMRLESISVGVKDDFRCFTALIDITEKRRVEDALKRINENLEQQVTQQIREAQLLAKAISHLGEGMLITNDQLDRPGPRIVYVNEAMCRITGYTPEELIGRTPRVMQGKNTDRATLDRINAELAAGRSCLVGLVNYRKDGTPYDAEIFITPMFDGEGHRTNFVSIHRDITERKQTERAVKDREERMRAILNNAVDAIITIDHRGIIDSVNPATVRMFGYTQEKLLGQNVKMLMPPPYRDEHDEYISRYLATGEARIIGLGREFQGRRKDGRVFPIDLAVSEIPHLRLFTGTIRDITERKELQERILQIAADEQRRIGQDLHDDVGQELTGLGLLANTARRAFERNATKVVDQSLAAIADGLKRVIGSVRKLSRGLHPVEIDAEGLMSALSELAGRVQESGGAKCTFACQQPVTFHDNVLSKHLFHIAQEATNNAIKHGHADRIEIALTKQDGIITMSIRDNGKGIDLSKKTEGDGLRIMRYRADLIHGDFTIKPQSGGGTLVMCTLPATSRM